MRSEKGITKLKLIIIIFIVVIILYGVFVISKNNKKEEKGMKEENKVVYREDNMNNVFIQHELNKNMINRNTIKKSNRTGNKVKRVNANEIETNGNISNEN